MQLALEIFVMKKKAAKFHSELLEHSSRLILYTKYLFLLYINNFIQTHAILSVTIQYNSTKKTR